MRQKFNCVYIAISKHYLNCMVWSVIHCGCAAKDQNKKIITFNYVKTECKTQRPVSCEITLNLDHIITERPKKR